MKWFMMLGVFSWASWSFSNLFCDLSSFSSILKTGLTNTLWELFVFLFPFCLLFGWVKEVVLLFFFLRQGLTMLLTLASNSSWSPGWMLTQNPPPSTRAKITGTYHPCIPSSSLQILEFFMLWIFSPNYSLFFFILMVCLEE